VAVPQLDKPRRRPPDLRVVDRSKNLGNAKSWCYSKIMSEGLGLRDRKKAQTRQRIADVAAALFAKHGYDVVTMLDVARVADVSDQTVYNYFVAKQDLVLDRAEQFRGLYRDAIVERPTETSPASALLPLVQADVERYRTAELEVARGEFIAQSVKSATLRRFTLEERERQAQVITEAILATAPELPRIVAHSHAAAIVAVIQALHDRIGTHILDRTAQEEPADSMLTTLEVAFLSLDQTFTCLLANADTSSG
jgi:AcrR family transcriptional regulator